MIRVYILYSKSLDRFYIGSTNDLHRRLVEHHAGKCITTRKSSDWILKASFKMLTLDEARAHEQKLKQFKSRRIIEKIIKNNHLKLIM